MRRNTTTIGNVAVKKTVTLLSTLLFAASPCLLAATPEPLPPPPELLDGGYGNSGMSVTLPYGGGQGGQWTGGQGQGYSPIQTAPQYTPAPQYNTAAPQYAPAPQPGNAGRGDVYDPYNTPVSNYLPPLPGQPAAEVGIPYAAPSPWQGGPAARPGQPFPVPNLQAPPMANLPRDGGFAPAHGQLTISPPSSNMPDEYFNLPFPVTEAGNIPGVLMPELNEEFYDPGMGMVTKRPIRMGMTQRQLEPFFDLAKNHEKGALNAKSANDAWRYQDELKKAVDGYMEIIAMADAGHEAREEAWYGVARCEYRRENWWKAFDALERSFPSKFDKNEVEGRIKLEMFIAERLWRMGQNPAPDARKEGAPLTGYQAASRVYAAAVFNQPNAKEAPLALLRRGDAAAMDGDWKEAAKFYRTVVQYYPESEPAMQARSSLAEAVYRQEWPGGFPESAREDLASVMTAVEAPEQNLSGPAEERRQRAITLANTHEAETKLRQAKDYMQKIRVKKSRDAAVFQLGEIVSHYPNTPQAHEASMLLRDMGIQPPMVLSDGNRYPIPSGGATMIDRVANTMASGGGSVQVAGQPDRRNVTPDARMQPLPDLYPEPSPFGRSQPGPAYGQNPAGTPAPGPGAWPSPSIALPPRPGYGMTNPGSMAGTQGEYYPLQGNYPPSQQPGFSPMRQDLQQNPYGQDLRDGYQQSWGQSPWGGGYPQQGGYANPGQGYNTGYAGGTPGIPSVAPDRRFQVPAQPHPAPWRQTPSSPRPEPRPEDVYVPGVGTGW